jgi:hypothetical protein
VAGNTEMAAGKLGLELQTFGVRAPDEFDRTFAAITGARAASLLVLPDPLFSAYTARIADLADKTTRDGTVGRFDATERNLPLGR